MTPAPALLALALGVAAQTPAAPTPPVPSGVTRIRALADSGSASLPDAVRERPNDARLAVRQLLERGAVRDSAGAAGDFAAADRVARAYAAVWADSFPLEQVDRFIAWSPAERSAKVAADSVRLAGNAALGRSGPVAAIRIWRESVRRCVALGDTAGMAAGVGNIGAGFYQMNELDSAEAYLERSRDLAERAGDRRTALNAFGTLGSVSKDRGELTRAQERYTQAFALRERIGDVRGMAADRNNLGQVAEMLGDLETARREYEAALAIGRQQDLPEAAGASLIGLGNVASQQGEYAEAISRYADALALYRDLDDQADVALVLHNLGLLDLRRGDYRAAWMRLVEARATYDRTGSVSDAVVVRRDLARAASARGDLQGALRELRGAEALVARAPPDPGLLAGLALARGDLAAELNTAGEAEGHYRRAEALYRRAHDQAGRAEAQHGLGLLLLMRENYPQAVATLAAAARVQDATAAPRSAALTRLSLAYAQQRGGDSAAARATLTGALDTLRVHGDRVGEAAAWGALADLADQTGLVLVAESLYRRGLDRLGAQPAPGISWSLHAGLGAALQSRGALPDAARELTAAIADVERISGRLVLEQRRAAFREDKWEPYAALVAVEGARGRSGEAFAVSERLRARQMVDLLARGRLPAGRDSVTDREQDLRRRIAELTQRLETGDSGVAGLRGSLIADATGAPGVTQEMLAQAQTRYAALLAEVREARPEYGRLVAGSTVSWRDVATRLAPGEALIEYLLGDSSSTVFVVTRDSVAAVDLSVGRAALAQLVDFVRGTMTRPIAGGGPRAPWRAPLRRLYDYLVAPVEGAGLLAGVERLIIVPHAELHYLPFGALVRRGSPDQFLVERYVVSLTPSASVWVRLGERPRTSATAVLALAPRIEALPASRNEVRAIAALFGTQATVLEGAAASEAAFRSAAGRYGILHLATFGVLNKHNPLFSFVSLAPGGAEDGRLEVHEVFGLSLNARLVVLSACQTAVGAGALVDVPAGDDWVGLSQAFLHAGAANVVATLWPVEDRATATLMEHFYREMAAGRSEREALATAQRSAVRNPSTAHPFYWAGFELVGGR